MRLIRSRLGQNMAEYAICLGVIIGAAIAMQQYVKRRLQATIHGYADAYVAEINKDTSRGTTINPAGTTAYEPTRMAVSKSKADLLFDGSKSGTVKSETFSQTGIDKTKD